MTRKPPNVRDFMPPEAVDLFLDLVQLISASMIGDGDDVETRIEALDTDERAALLVLAVGTLSGGIKALGLDVDTLMKAVS
ncbi:hypothetical protein JOJ86_001472 [Rhodococcus percolatus]|uniref:hypothetical protein n=1 Tax=Rhodococcus opacus TaxID=37919 RepID=UPI0015FBCE55|nr:hypothetical protein [Rhodococcus opacus]MBA8958181.1 hypothetical protein [Rhodococcus opacus]MBP2203746.1 hypothetical protein [Rhodococcus opacus]